MGYIAFEPMDNFRIIWAFGSTKQEAKRLAAKRSSAYHQERIYQNSFQVEEREISHELLSLLGENYETILEDNWSIQKSKDDNLFFSPTWYICKHEWGSSRYMGPNGMIHTGPIYFRKFKDAEKTLEKFRQTCQ